MNETIIEILKRALEDEIRYRLGRTPNEQEKQSALEYIDFMADDDMKTWSDIETTLDDWIHDKTYECAVCGCHYLKDDCETMDNGDHVCYEKGCKEDWYDEQGFDPHAEWGTDGRHTC